MKLCKNPKLDYKVMIDSGGNFHYKEGTKFGEVVGVFWLLGVGYVLVSDTFKRGKSIYDKTSKLYEES